MDHSMENDRTKVFEGAVPSLVQVRFQREGMPLTYFNDRFDLRPGDEVFVSGKLAGRLGTVETVSTHFRIRPSDYERVVGKSELRLKGTFAPWCGYYAASVPGDLTAGQFRSGVKAPVEEDEELVWGDGWSFRLEELERSEDVETRILQRAVEYANDGNLAFLSLREGVGTAFLEGTQWYEVNFRYESGEVTDLFCDCPYPGLCKHALAASLVLRRYLAEHDADELTLLHRSTFLHLLDRGGKEITVW